VNRLPSAAYRDVNYTHQADKTSKQLAQAHRPVLADIRASTNFSFHQRNALSHCWQTLFGSRIWDVDGNEYIDLMMGFGVNGHNPPFVKAAWKSNWRKDSSARNQSLQVRLLSQFVN